MNIRDAGGLQKLRTTAVIARKETRTSVHHKPMEVISASSHNEPGSRFSPEPQVRSTALPLLDSNLMRPLSDFHRNTTCKKCKIMKEL